MINFNHRSMARRHWLLVCASADVAGFSSAATSAFSAPSYLREELN